MNYSIIKNEQKLCEFIEWLPTLEKNEKFFVCLQARKKYNSLVRSDKAQLKRFMATKETLLNKLRQLEVPIGAYQLDDPVPNDSLVAYITPNPRNTKKAALNTIKDIATAISEDNDKNNLEINPYQLALSAIHRAKSRSVFVDFDMDGLTGDDIYDKIAQIVTPDAFTIIQTRGGCHVLVKPDKAAGNWHKLIREAFKVDQVGDLMIPIPGCIQGDSSPEMWSKND